MIYESQYEAAKATLADIDCRKDSVLQAFKRAMQGYESDILDSEHQIGCLNDTLSETFYEAECAAILVRDRFESQEKRRHETIESYKLIAGAFA